MTPLTIETQRLTLKAFTPEVYHHAFTHLTDSEVMDFFGHQNESELATEKERFEKGMTTFNRSFLFFQLREKETNRFLGWCGYHTWYLTHYRAELFYMLITDSDKRKGLISEALTTVLNYGFNEMKLVRIEAFTATDNTASIATLHKFGFTREGLLRKHYHSKGENTDSVAFGLLKEEYL